MMDVVPAHICVSSITTARRPAPVHTLWSSHPTNNPVLVSENTFLIFHAFSSWYESENIGCSANSRRGIFLYIWMSAVLIDISIYTRLLLSRSHLDLTKKKVCKGAFLEWLIFNHLTSVEKVPPVCAAVWNPWCGHWQPLYERHDGANSARHWWCHSGGLWRPGGEDLLGRHQNPNHQTGLHQRHPARDHHFCRWVHSRHADKMQMQCSVFYVLQCICLPTNIF